MGEETQKPAELLQGDELAADTAAKRIQALASAERVNSVLVAEHEAMLGIAPGLRSDYMCLKTILDHAQTKI